MVSTTTFMFPMRGPTIVILDNTTHKLFIYDFGIPQMVQSSDRIIYFSMKPDQNKHFHQKVDQIMYLKHPLIWIGFLYPPLKPCRPHPKYSCQSAPCIAYILVSGNIGHPIGTM